MGQAVQQQMSQQELVHVPQQEAVSEHQRFMDQLLGVAPTVPQTVPIQPETCTLEIGVCITHCVRLWVTCAATDGLGESGCTTKCTS
eukprot:4979810-Amphidinium_carterae.1